MFADTEEVLTWFPAQFVRSIQCCVSIQMSSGRSHTFESCTWIIGTCFHWINYTFIFINKSLTLKFRNVLKRIAYFSFFLNSGAYWTAKSYTVIDAHTTFKCFAQKCAGLCEWHHYLIDFHAALTKERTVAADTFVASGVGLWLTRTDSDSLQLKAISLNLDKKGQQTLTLTEQWHNMFSFQQFALFSTIVL